jgi:hypothetical protein
MRRIGIYMCIYKDLMGNSELWECKIIMSLAGLGRKNDSADEDQQQFTISLPYPEGKKQLGRPSRTWEENIEIDLREVG